MSTKQESKTTVSHLPEHGPIDENGREILLQVKNVDITFGKGDDAVKAVKNASFDIYKGETFSLVGESGSGKTTIGRAVIRVNPCSAGEILYKGVKISGKIPHSLDREVIRNIQMVFQDPAASLNERATVDYLRRCVPTGAGADCQQTQTAKGRHNADFFRAGKVCGLRLVAGIRRE